MDTELIPKHNNLIGGQSTLSLILREILGGSMTVILPKIAPKPYTKTEEAQYAENEQKEEA